MAQGPLPLNVPFYDGREEAALLAALRAGRLGGGGAAMQRVEPRLARRFDIPNACLTTSCTHALELLTMVHDLGPGDEVILPSYAHSSAATAVLRQGARPVFADCLADEPHVDVGDVERRVTKRTRAVFAVHYGGIPSGAEALSELCRERGLLLLEDAAQAFDARHAGRACGTLGDGGAISFHETKNISCGEGGLLLLRDSDKARRAETLREMGTDRAQYRAGRAAGYTWLGPGSSFLPSDLLVSMLEVQLEKADQILARRRALFERYLELLKPVATQFEPVLPQVPPQATPNGHLFFVLLPDERTRTHCLEALKSEQIGAAPHFQALHDTPFGRSLRDEGEAPLPNAERIARRLLRLPLHPALTNDDQDRIVACLATASRSG